MQESLFSQDEILSRAALNVSILACASPVATFDESIVDTALVDDSNTDLKGLLAFLEVRSTFIFLLLSFHHFIIPLL